MKLTKEQYAECMQTLRLSADDSGMKALALLLEHDYERVKDLLVSTHPGEVPALQGEAQAYKRYLKALKEPRRASTSEV